MGMSTFLIVDDSQFMRNILRGIITSDGHIVIGEASNGQQAFEEYMRLQPEIVMMDITMDDINGIQGLKLIRGYDPGAVVIMCSAIGQQCFVTEAIQSGAKDFIVKPFTRDRVLGVIAHVLN